MFNNKNQESIINNQSINQWFILQGNGNSFPSLGVQKEGEGKVQKLQQICTIKWR